MNKLLLFFIFSTTLLNGCQSYFGPNALHNTHPAYNQVIVNSLSQQMLLNLVRIKYRDNPHFLEVGSVTAAMSFTSSIGMDSEFDLGSGGNIIEPNQGIGYSDEPTISFTPLQGEDFLKSMLSSISLEAILVMTQSGWDIERVFGLCIERMNDLHNAPLASGPTPAIAPDYKKFKRKLYLFGQLQLSGDMEIGPNFSRGSKSRDLRIVFESDHVDPTVGKELRTLLDFTQTSNDDSNGTAILNAK